MSFCVDGISCGLSNRGIDLVRWFPNGHYYVTNAKEAEYVPLESPCIGFAVDYCHCTDDHFLLKVIKDVLTNYLNRHDLAIRVYDLKEVKTYVVIIYYSKVDITPFLKSMYFNTFAIGSKQRLASLIKKYLPKLERKPLRNPDGGKKWIEWHLRKL